jgi:phosphoribosylpyrophosphate synthetase
MELLIMIDTAKRDSEADCGGISLTGYGRTDKKISPGPHHGRLVADRLLEGQPFLTLDLHAGRFKASSTSVADESSLFIYSAIRSAPKGTECCGRGGRHRRDQTLRNCSKPDCPTIIENAAHKRRRVEVLNVIGDVEGKTASFSTMKLIRPGL